MVVSSKFSVLSSELAQCVKARIIPIALAVARALVPIDPADRAQSAAVVPAERLHRQREVELLPHQMTEIDLVVLIERRRQIVVFDFLLWLPGAGVLALRVIAEIEIRVDRQRERLQTPAAVQLQCGLHPADKAKLLLVLEDVERQRDRSGDPEIGIGAQLTWLVDLLEPLLRRPDLCQIQEQHEPPNITRNW